MRSVICGYCEKTFGYGDKDVHSFRFEVRKRFRVIRQNMRVVTCPFCESYVEVEDEEKKSNKK